MYQELTGRVEEGVNRGFDAQTEDAALTKCFESCSAKALKRVVGCRQAATSTCDLSSTGSAPHKAP